MNTTPLTPGITTHFRWLGTSIFNLTRGKIYKILEWRNGTYHFLNDKGGEIFWNGQLGVEDASYEENLKEILE